MSGKLPRQSLAPRLISETGMASVATVPTTAKQPVAPAAVRRVSSRALLGESQSLVIDHEGVSYILRATRLGKLILTK